MLEPEKKLLSSTSSTQLGQAFKRKRNERNTPTKRAHSNLHDRRNSDPTDYTLSEALAPVKDLSETTDSATDTTKSLVKDGSQSDLKQITPEENAGVLTIETNEEKYKEKKYVPIPIDLAHANGLHPVSFRFYQCKGLVSAMLILKQKRDPTKPPVLDDFTTRTYICRPINWDLIKDQTISPQQRVVELKGHFIPSAKQFQIPYIPYGAKKKPNYGKIKEAKRLLFAALLMTDGTTRLFISHSTTNHAFLAGLSMFANAAGDLFCEENIKGEIELLFLTKTGTYPSFTSTRKYDRSIAKSLFDAAGILESQLITYKPEINTHNTTAQITQMLGKLDVSIPSHCVLPPVPEDMPLVQEQPMLLSSSEKPASLNEKAGSSSTQLPEGLPNPKILTLK